MGQRQRHQAAVTADNDHGSTEVREPRSLTRLQQAAAAVTAISIIVAGVVGVAHWALGIGSAGSRHRNVAEKGTVETVAFRPHGTSASVDTRVHINGESGKPVRVVWTLMDAERSEPVQQPGFQQQQIAAFSPTSDNWTRDYSATVPAPNTTDLVFLRVAILDQSGQELDFADTNDFRLGGGPSP